MRQPIVLQVKGLGIPVLIENAKGAPELRWSSDPDIPADAPAYLFHDAAEISEFLTHAIDKRFINEDTLQLIRVTADQDAPTLSRTEAQQQGISTFNWDAVRAGLIISGSSARGPVSESLEWIGDRVEYEDSAHMLAAFEYAVQHGIKAPTIVPHSEAMQTLNAAEFMTSFHQTIKPQLLSAHKLLHKLTSELNSIDFQTLNPDRAVHVLKQVTAALLNVHEQDNLLRQSLGMDARALAQLPEQKPQPSVSANNSSSESHLTIQDGPVDAEPDPDPKQFREPRLG